jgi:hypothetical protein
MEMDSRGMERLEFATFGELCEWYLDMIENGRPDDYTFSVVYGETRRDGDSAYRQPFAFAGTEGPLPDSEVPEPDDGSVLDPDLARAPIAIEE